MNSPAIMGPRSYLRVRCNLVIVRFFADNSTNIRETRYVSVNAFLCFLRVIVVASLDFDLSLLHYRYIWNLLRPFRCDSLIKELFALFGQ